jgi:Protein of unknown function (DUF3237)
MPNTAPPGLKPVTTIDVQVGPIQDLGVMPLGRRRIIPILGGTAQGPRLMGTVVPGGADWQVVRGDGVIELVAHYALKTHDGVAITVVNRGLRHAAPEVMARLAKGEIVDPALVYCRAIPTFEAPDGAYAWMNRSVFLSSVARFPDRVQVTVFEVA